MEWYTLTVALGLFMVYCVTAIAVDAVLYLFSLANISTNVGFALRWVGIPSGFVTLMGYLPHFFLSGLYMMYTLPESKWFKEHWVWDWMRSNYWQFEEQNAPKRDTQYLYATFPHGVFASATIVHFTLNKMYSDVVCAGTSLLFWIPLVREFTAVSGSIPANTHDIVEQLDKGKSVALVPEGLRGLLHNSNEGTLELLEKRKGFIRCAIGSSKADELCIVPVYMDGQRDLFTVWMIFPWLQSRLLSKFYYPWPILSWGNWVLPFWPRAGKVIVKYGKPIPVGGKSVDEVHAVFLKEVERLMQQQEEE